jgi:DNA polymerase-1
VADPVKRKLLLVDGHAYAYRAYYAIRNLRSPDGQATNAIFGFIKMLGKMRELVQPSHLAVVWDGGLSRERLELVPDYKAQRPEMPEDLASQIVAIGTYLEAAGVVSLEAEAIEADDWIATLAMMSVGAGAQVVIASSDKDFYQLVSPMIGLLNPADKSQLIWNDLKVEEKTGVQPEQIVDWLSLMGDAVDNIAGVAGVGPKTAAELLKQFGSVEGLYGRLAEIKSTRLRDALEKSRDLVVKNQKMVRLLTNVPGSPELENLKNRPEDPVQLTTLFRQWGFKGMVSEVEARAAHQQQLFAA